MSAISARIGRKLVERSLLTEAELAGARACADERGLELDEALVALGLVTEDQAGALLAEEHGVPYVFPYAASVDKELLRRFPAALLRRLEALPFALEEGSVVLAATRMLGDAERKELEDACGGPIALSLAARRRVRSVLDQALGGRGAEPRADTTGGGGPASSTATDDPAAVALLYGHLARALAEGAGEVRFEPEGAAIKIRYRKHGALEERAQAPLASLLPLVARARILAGVQVASGGPCNAATLATTIGGRDILLEVAILRAREGESVLVRMSPRPKQGEDLVALGCEPAAAEALRPALQERRGLFVVAGDFPYTRRAALALARSAATAGRAAIVLERAPVDTEPGLRRVAIAATTAATLVATRPWGADVIALLEPLEAPEDVDAALLAADSAVVIAIAIDPGPAAALRGLLERGARPSRLARAVRGFVTLTADAGRFRTSAARAPVGLAAAIARGAPLDDLDSALGGG